MIGALFAIAIVGGIAISITIARLLYLCQPNEVVVFSGMRRRRQDHSLTGYRIIRGGRGVRIPLFEVVDRIDLTNMIIDVAVSGAYSKGGIPLAVQGVANIKIPGEEPLLSNALERFLGVSRSQISKVAQDTLEGNLRGVLATLTPEQVNQDKEKFSTQLAQEAEHDLNRLGLVLDTLKIQSVSDDVGYLDAIGRVPSAAIRRDAQVAESDARAEAAEKKWQTTMEGELSKIAAQIEILRTENGRRIADAETKREAAIAQQRAAVQALIAGAEAEVKTQMARAEQVRLQLEADVVQPAEAARKQAVQQARAEAADVIESGTATANVLKDLAKGYAQSGSTGRDALLMQKLLPIIQKLTSAGHLKVDRVTVLGNGGAAPATGNAGGGAGGDGGGGKLAGKLVDYNEQVRAATGVDLASLARAEAAVRKHASQHLPDAAVYGSASSTGGEYELVEERSDDQQDVTTLAGQRDAPGEA